MNLCVQIALVFNQYVNPIGLENLGWKYYIFYCVWIAVELVVVYFCEFLSFFPDQLGWLLIHGFPSVYVETKGPTLEEIAKIFDGEDALVGHVHIKESGEVVGGDLSPTHSYEKTQNVEHREV